MIPRRSSGSSRADSAVEPTKSQNRELAALGLILPRWFGLRGCRRCRCGNRSAAEIADRAQHFQPVPERDAEVLEVLIGQVGENGNIDPILNKAVGVLGHAERFEPIRNLLHSDQRPWSAELSFRPSQYCSLHRIGAVRVLEIPITI
jgi:hypothetical protein